MGKYWNDEKVGGPMKARIPLGRFAGAFRRLNVFVFISFNRVRDQRHSFIHSIFVLFVTICKTGPPADTAATVVTRNLKSTYASSENVNGSNGPIVDGWKFEDMLLWSTVDGRESPVNRACSMRPPMSETHR